MEAQIGIERWRRHYNEERPHMSLGDLTPAEFKKQMGTTHGWLGGASATKCWSPPGNPSVC